MDTINKKQDVQIVKLELMNSQVELIKHTLESYLLNLDFILSNHNFSNEERQQNLAMLKCTFETITIFQSLQVNGVSHNSETINKFGKNIINNENLIEFIPNIDEA